MGALTLLVLLQLVGEGLARLMNLPLPGGLVGMVLLLAALLVRGRTPAGLTHTSRFLLQNLMLLFIPFIAGIMDQVGLLRSQWLPFLAACVLGAVASLLTTAWTLRWMIARRAAGASDAR